MNASKIIECLHLSKSFKKNGPLDLKDISLDIKRGESLVIIGSSGSGKTTLLKMLNGLEEPSSGTILIKGKDIKSYDITVLRRTFFGSVFQKIGLFPHMTIKENLDIILYINKKPLEYRNHRIQELLELMGLSSKTYLNRYPRELSGGEQQRIGVARALATDAECLLMDEPFGALDALTRCDLQNEILKLKKRLKKTLIFVTHDIVEAFKMGDRIAVMQEGKIVQIGTRDHLCKTPHTLFVKNLVEIGLRGF